jgi:hypothetical protein
VFRTATQLCSMASDGRTLEGDAGLLQGVSGADRRGQGANSVDAAWLGIDEAWSAALGCSNASSCTPGRWPRSTVSNCAPATPRGCSMASACTLQRESKVSASATRHGWEQDPPLPGLGESEAVECGATKRSRARPPLVGGTSSIRQAIWPHTMYPCSTRRLINPEHRRTLLRLALEYRIGKTHE